MEEDELNFKPRADKEKSLYYYDPEAVTKHRIFSKGILLFLAFGSIIWFSYILWEYGRDALGTVIFWSVIQTLIFTSLFYKLKFISPLQVDVENKILYGVGKPIHLSDVHYIEAVTWFHTIPSIGIGYMNPKGKPVVVHSTGHGKVFDLVEFTNIIREIKGWRKQWQVTINEGSGQGLGYYRWRDQVKKTVIESHKKLASIALSETFTEK